MDLKPEGRLTHFTRVMLFHDGPYPDQAGSVSYPTAERPPADGWPRQERADLR
jgi:hypothetical protein